MNLSDKIQMRYKLDRDRTAANCEGTKGFKLAGGSAFEIYRDNAIMWPPPPNQPKQCPVLDARAQP